MAEKLSAQITNRDAVPRVLEDSRETKARLQESCALVEVASTDASDDVIRYFSVPSNARISQILLSCDDSGTAGAMDIGVYQTTENGGAVVDADLFASAQVLTTALTNSDVTYESGQYNIDESEAPLWSVLGLSADSNRDYDICGTLTTAAESDATTVLKGRFVV